MGVQCHANLAAITSRSSAAPRYSRAMTSVELARQLRQRLTKKGLVSAELLATLPDDAIIDSYNTCSCCGEKFLPPDQFAEVVRRAVDDESFLALCDDADAKFKQHAKAPN